MTLITPFFQAMLMRHYMPPLPFLDATLIAAATFEADITPC